MLVAVVVRVTSLNVPVALLSVVTVILKMLESDVKVNYTNMKHEPHELTCKDWLVEEKIVYSSVLHTQILSLFCVLQMER